MSGVKILKKGEILFREGDPSDAMYVIKKGRIAITKAKGSSEINLAELVPGEMLGEMAFFDNKPRSAGAKAAADSEVIGLPFVALHAQFKTFPEWLKAMVKTVNSHLRNANQRIKNLESVQSQDAEMFPPHTISRLCAIIDYVAHKAGEETEEGLNIPSGRLRNYCIQIFQQPTHKMQKLMEILQSLGHFKVEDIGEGRQKLTLISPKLLSEFVDWYNDYLFKEESKRITVVQAELPIIRALIFYGKQQEANEKGEVTISLTDMQNNSMRDLNQLINATDPDSLAEKGLTHGKVSAEGGNVMLTFILKDLETVLPFWEIIYTLKGISPLH